MNSQRRQTSERARARLVVYALLLVLAPASTGCQQLMSILGSLVGGGGIGGGFNGGGGLPGLGGGGLGGGGLGGGLPGLINGPGTGPLSPTSALPPPSSGTVPAQQLEQTYGVRITGSGATAENLQKLALGMSRYKREHFRGLAQLDLPAVRSHNLNGLWQSRGGQCKVTVWAHTGRRSQIYKNTVVHEIGHHVSLFSRRQVLGQPLSNAIGTGQNAFPRNYARKNWKEKVADNLAFILLGQDADYRAARTWQPTQAAMSIIRQEFGR